MLWCFTGAAIILALLGLAALTARPRLPPIRPLLLLRGCAALLFLLAAAGLLALALWLNP